VADYAPNYTPRLRVRYKAAGRIHTQTWRFVGTGATPDITAAIAAVNNYYSAISPSMLSDWTLVGAAAAGRDSNIFVPVTGVVFGTGPTPFDPADRAVTALALSFVGRTVLGLRAVVYQYGTAFSDIGVAGVGNDFRIYAAEDSNIANAITALQGAGATLCGNDGDAISWYPYVNLKVNDYWLHRVRSGA
jgi:hypothetical protein